MTLDHQLQANAIAKGNILVVATSCSAFPDGKPTGSDPTEMGVSYVVWKSNGFDVTIASIKGGEIPWDPSALKLAQSEDAPSEVKRFLKNDAVQQQVRNSVPLERVQQLEGLYSAIFLPGGHGAAFDLPKDPKLISLLAEANAKDIPIAAVCHGPAALINVPEKPDGSEGWMVKRRRIVCYSNEEELQGGTAQMMPYMMEDELRKKGADVVVGPPGAECAERDGNVITAQNPASVFKMATLVLEALTANYPAETVTPSTLQSSVLGAKKTGTGSVAQALGTNPPQQNPEEVSRLR